ncbi:mediator complex, subunit Med16 [Lophiotrema nucula]|uniref:Mediator of RNA polymerase II transcription subunit 16 n=1 Tax=Lophiotrema nucula TaxID=690887 RepID=A0A6A5YNI7_9PLEO|nr:mediator complex, subunit Med16 [Lophiotrema nucula]
MPFMDDQSYNMDVDDLFGDSEQVALPAISAPPVKGLARRLDELSTSGCSQRISWSKNGAVAYITPDGYGVNLKVFSRDQSTGKWDLGKDVPLEIPHHRDEYPYVHLSWSHLGNDIAIMDAAGHVIIFSCNMALDRMTYMRADTNQPEAEMDAVVGMHWLAILPYEQKAHVPWSASGKGDKWKFQIQSHTFKDAHHPAEGKAALMYLKRHGELKLRYQQHDNSWHEVTAFLGPLLSTRELFTHAAFASNNDNTLLLAAYDVVGRLHLYRIETKWNVPKPTHGQPPKPFEKPELQVSEVDVLDSCYPVSSDVANGDLNTTSESRTRMPAQLTHLNFLPITLESNDGSIPTIQALFSTPPNMVSLDQTQLQQSPYSIVVRWEVHHTQQTQLHSSLDKVTSKKKSVGSLPARDVFLLKRVPDTVLHSVVLSFHSLWYHMILAFCYSDGSIEFRKRVTMDVMGPDYNTQTVSSLPQAGFHFSALEPALHIALSPNHCIAACMQQDGSIKLKPMEYSDGALSSDEDDDRRSAALAALVLQSASAANQYFSSDDLFSIIGPLSEKRKRDFIGLMFSGLNVNIDCGIDDNSQQHLVLLGRSPFFVKTLSAAHLLGLQGSVGRSLSSKIAWEVLNIKYVTQILTTISRMHGQIEKTPLRPEVVPQFIGICRWIMHFMAYIIDEVIALGYAVRDIPDLNRNTLEAKIEELNKPGILLLLSSFPRMMMKLWANPIAWAWKTAGQYTQNGPTAEVRRIYSPLQAAIADCPFDWRLFDTLVAEAHSLVRGTYRTRNLTEHQRNDAERELLLGKIPDVLVPVAKRLLTDSLFGENLPNNQTCLLDKPGFDVARVMFFDTTWLGLNDSKHADLWFQSHVVDVCQKMIIRGTGAQTHPTSSVNQRARSGSASEAQDGKKGGGRKLQLRKCVRCGACMEDVTQGMPGYANHHVSWLMGVAKHCVCGNGWMLVSEKEGKR